MRFIVFALLTSLVVAACESKSNPNVADKPFSEEQFHFIAEDSFLMYDFTMTRKYFSDSTFEDGPLLCQSDSASVCSIRFKKVDNFWHVMTRDGWQEFYSPKDSLLKVVYFKDDKYILKPTGQSMIYNNRQLKGFIKEDLYVHSSHQSYLYFDPEFGVVLIEGDVSLVRDDFDKRSR